MASAAASRRRDRSFRSRSTAVKRSRITDVSIIPDFQRLSARAGIPTLKSKAGPPASRDSVDFGRRLRQAQCGDVIIVKTDPPLLSVLVAPIAWIMGLRAINRLQDLSKLRPPLA